MQQQPQVDFPPPPYQQELHPPPPPPPPPYQQQQPQVNYPPPAAYQQEQLPPLPPGQNRGVFAAPLPHVQAPQVGSKLDPIELVNILLRFVAVLMIFIATVIVGATKYTKVYEYSYSYETKTMWIYKLGSLSPIKYFLAANSIVLFYSVATLLISISSMLMKNKQGNDTLRNKLIMLFVAGDLAAVVFLFSAIGSAAGSKDTFNAKSDFNPENESICEFVKDGFCDKWVAGIVMSMFAAVAYLLLQLLSVYSLTKMNNTPPTTTRTEIAFPSPVVVTA